MSDKESMDEQQRQQQQRTLPAQFDCSQEITTRTNDAVVVVSLPTPITTTTTSSTTINVVNDDGSKKRKFHHTDDGTNDLDKDDVTLKLQQEQEKQQQEQEKHQHHQQQDHEQQQQLLLEQFQQQQHSLRISVSNIAAICGYHPYKDIPQLLLYQHVYQGRMGKLLLQHDTKLLDIEILSNEQVIQNLVQKVNNVDTQTIVDTVLNIQRGTTKIHNIETANAMKHNPAIVEITKQSLSKVEYQLLQDHIHHAINTGYGIHLEDDALNLYEQQIGYPVEQRNLSVCDWPFGIRRISRNDDSSSCNSTNPTVTTTVATTSDTIIFPIRPASAIIPSTTTSTTKTIENVQQQDGDVINVNDNKEVITQQQQLPYFSIVGSVDGIREEMAPIITTTNNSNTNNANTTTKRSMMTNSYHDKSNDNQCNNFDETEEDDDPWEMRSVIVECKHRMNVHGMKSIPPFYELIQTSIYCLMYNIQYADIVQVIRTSSSSSSSSLSVSNESTTTTTTINPISTTSTTAKSNSSTTTAKVSSHAQAKNESLKTTTTATATIDLQRHKSVEHQQEQSKSKRNCNSKDDDNNNNLTDHNKTNKKKKRAATSSNNVSIAVHRLDIDDPIVQHRSNFYTVLLPRIQLFCDAVYTLRQNDDIRYQLLYAIASNDVVASWNIVFDLCPYLIDCDTAFRYIHQEKHA